MFGVVSLTEKVDIERYKYYGCIIGFDRHREFSVDSRVDKNVIIFGIESYTRIRTYTDWTAEKWYLINLTINLTNNFVWACIIIEQAVIGTEFTVGTVIVNGTETITFKGKDYELVATPLCLGNISKHFLVDNMKKTGLNGYVNDFSVDYEAIELYDILDIHKYLMKKHNIV